LTNIHFAEYLGKEINIPKWNSQLTRPPDEARALMWFLPASILFIQLSLLVKVEGFKVEIALPMCKRG
jgi:hypothetical protein